MLSGGAFYAWSKVVCPSIACLQVLSYGGKDQHSSLIVQLNSSFFCNSQVGPFSYQLICLPEIIHPILEYQNLLNLIVSFEEYQVLSSPMLCNTEAYCTHS
jgi:hypothetical protein